MHGTAQATISLLIAAVLCTAHAGILSISPDAFGDSIDVWYQIPSDVQPNDRIALYTKETTDFNNTSPLRYVFAQTSLWTPNRRAAAGFWVPNYGVDLQVAYLRGPLLNESAVVEVAPLAISSKSTPTQGRLVVSRRTGEIRVIWRSQIAASPVVKFGTQPGNHTQQQYASTDTYTSQDMCRQPASSSGFYTPGIINTAVLRGLLPNTTYYYVYGQEATGFSHESNFTIPPAADTATDRSPVRLLAAAELGTYSVDGAVSLHSTELQQRLLGRLAVPGSPEYTLIKAAMMATGQLTPAPGSKATQQQMQSLLSKQPHHGLLLLGGLSMAAGQAVVWDDFLAQMQPILSQVPLAAAAGEVEAADALLRAQVFNSSASAGECGVPYEQLLRMPHAVRYDMWYSVDVGPVHLVMLNTEQNLTQGSAQYNFLQTELLSVNRSATPWVIVGMHRGLYVDDPSQQAPDGSALVAAQLREQLEPLLVAQQVDLVLNGHGRVYHQSCPVVKGTCVGYSGDGSALGPVHVMLGNGGAAVPLLAWANPPNWLEAESFEHGFVQLTASRTALELQMISSRTGQHLADLKLTKPESWKPDPAAAALLFSHTAGTPDPQGIDSSALQQLLQEDLLAAALAAGPAKLASSVGSGSRVADIISSLPLNDAPTPGQTWQVSTHLAQLVLSLMSRASRAPAAQPSNSPPPPAAAAAVAAAPGPAPSTPAAIPSIPLAPAALTASPIILDPVQRQVEVSPHPVMEPLSPKLSPAGMVPTLPSIPTDAVTTQPAASLPLSAKPRFPAKSVAKQPVAKPPTARTWVLPAPLPAVKKVPAAAPAAMAAAAAPAQPSGSPADEWVVWGSNRKLQQSLHTGVNGRSKFSRGLRSLSSPLATSDLYIQMSQNLLLVRADGSQVPRKTVEAFVYYMILLQGRLAFRG